MPEILGICPVEGGVVLIAAKGEDFGGFFPAQDHFPGGNEPLRGNVSSDGSTGGFLKAAAKL